LKYEIIYCIKCTQKNRAKKQKIKKIICWELSLAPGKGFFAGSQIRDTRQIALKKIKNYLPGPTPGKGLT
jgi:hypothetical protein